jgi:hypothetical protein
MQTEKQEDECSLVVVLFKDLPLVLHDPGREGATCVASSTASGGMSFMRKGKRDT